MHEWTVTIETQQLDGLDEETLELFFVALAETAVLGPAVSVSHGALGATFTVEAERPDDASREGFDAFGVALAPVMERIGVDEVACEELHVELVRDREPVLA